MLSARYPADQEKHGIKGTPRYLRRRTWGAQEAGSAPMVFGVKAKVITPAAPNQ